MIGKKLAHYEITGFLGEGGMGAVYRARDGKLGREVALKILPREFAENAERLARFQREARTLASLSHPHIASIYGLEEAGEERFLVMELIEGEDLSARMQRGAIPVEEALAIGLQIAEALESAHENGVIHRDLKPANIKLTSDGEVKLLDFGLARAVSSGAEDDGDPANSPTITAAFTAAGTILGTAAYMSPEQARGRNVDRRADIWAFGTVLFEMLSGQKLFAGETVSDTLASVIKEEPDWETLPVETPAVLVAVMRRCLQKNLKQRLQSIGEARIAIQELKQGDESSFVSASLMTSAVDAETVSSAQARRAPALLWILALIAVGIAAFVIGSRSAAPQQEPRLRRFTLQPRDLDVNYPTQPALSPDGRRIAYFAGTALYIQDLHGLESIEIPETEGATSPFWSPDGQWLGFGMQGRIYKVPATGGRPQKICDVDFSTLDGAAWSEDGKMILSPDAGPMRAVSDQGGDPEIIFPLGAGESDFHTPSVLPEGRGILFTTHNQDGRETIEVLVEGERRIILKIPGARLEYATWSAAAPSNTRGHLVYHRLNSNPGIWAVPFDLESLEVTGDPFLLDSNGAYPSVGRDGSLLYANSSGWGPMQLVVVDRKGSIVRRIGEAEEGIRSFAISPDGKSVLVENQDAGSGDIWLYDLERESRGRMSFAQEDEFDPGWLGDGSQIHYTRAGGGVDPDTWIRPFSGAGDARLLLSGYSASSVPSSELIVFVRFNGQTSNDLYYAPLDSPDDAKLLVGTPRSEVGPRISPDGRFVAYMSTESGRNEVYLIPLQGGEGKWQISTQGGVWPRWNPNGREIVYRVGTGSAAVLMSVSLETESGVRLGDPVRLFGASDAPSLYFGSGFGAYDILPDSNQLLLLEQADYGPGRNQKLMFIEDWHASYMDKLKR